MIVLKPLFVNADGEKIFDIKLINLKWNFILNIIKTYCKQYKYDKENGFKIWWWATDDNEDEINHMDRTGFINIDGIEPTDQYINTFNIILEKIEKDELGEEYKNYIHDVRHLLLTFDK